MASSGVEDVRANFYWDLAEPLPNVFVWSQSDPIVAAAASHGLQLLPIVEFTPQWASSHPQGAYANYAPTNSSSFAAFMAAEIKRYGPHGTFWAANPQLHKVPIRAWQIWNEPAGTKYDWRTVPWPSTYTKLLSAAYRATHRADRGAKVVLGAMVGLNGTNLTPWAETSSLYRAGAGRFFDILAVNAFTNSKSASDSVRRSLEIVSKVRAVMRAHHNGKKPIWVTEVTWTAAAGKLPSGDYAGFETTPQGQAARLAAYFARIATNPGDGIARAFWYTWASSYQATSGFNIPPTFQFSGLTAWTPGHAFTALPVLSTYARVAAKYEGCRKTTNAQRCR